MDKGCCKGKSLKSSPETHSKQPSTFSEYFQWFDYVFGLLCLLLQEAKPMKRILQNHKNFYAYLTKFGHNINKLFSDEINLIFRHDTLPEESLVLEVKNAKK